MVLHVTACSHGTLEYARAVPQALYSASLVKALDSRINDNLSPEVPYYRP